MIGNKGIALLLHDADTIQGEYYREMKLGFPKPSNMAGGKCLASFSVPENGIKMLKVAVAPFASFFIDKKQSGKYAGMSRRVMKALEEDLQKDVNAAEISVEYYCITPKKMEN